MIVSRAVAYSFLAAIFWVKATRAQDPTVTGQPVPFPPLARLASTCGPDTTSCGGIGFGAITTNIGPIKTDTTTITEVVNSTFIKTVLSISPTVITRTRSNKGICNLVSTVTISTPITRLVTETATKTIHSIVDVTSVEVKTYIEEVDPVDDCIISINDVGVTAQPVPTDPSVTIGTPSQSASSTAGAGETDEDL